MDPSVKEIVLALIAAIPPTLMALATLIATLKLKKEVNGHTSKLMEAMQKVGHVEGRTEALLDVAKPKIQVVDRRHGDTPQK
jgi:hypothetical protein